MILDNGRLALLLGVVFSVAADYTLFVPGEKNIHWTPANHSSLRCPVRSAVHPVSGRIGNLPLLLPIHPNSNDEPGYSCHKVEWISECSEGFFGGTDVQQYIRHLEPNAQECKDAWKAKRDGLEVTPYFEAPKCQWMNTVRKAHTFVVVNTKATKTDPYTLEYVDPLFPGGRCTTKEYCPTIQGGVIWLPLKPVDPKVKYEWRTVNADYGTSAKDSKTYLIWGGGMPTTKLKGACRMSFQGQEGIRFSSGFWAGTKTETWSNKNFTDAIGELSACSSNLIARFPSAHEEIAEHEMEINDLILSLKCYDIVREFEETGKISFLDLGFFNPETSGPGHIYRIKDGILEAASVHYRECPILPGKFSKIHCKPSTDWTIYDTWVPTGIPGILSAFNGVYKENGIVNYAGYNLWNNKLTEADIQRMELQPVPHPVTLSIQKYAPGLNITMDETGERGEVDLDILGGLSHLGRSILKYISLTGILIFSLVFSYYMIKLACNRQVRNSRRERVEMEGFY
ncbi:glycoprotein [Hainan black-spectacled toad rhabdovirus]|uniref:Glycoprotein n=1 Tax=Hainan black-spectacled toad rhabdovirus TaxID=2847103 RepID=A0A2P1GMU0_9RHAB|nr:glycoprotein [Hainan black-spectacled toad rhabdovirus]AVM87302.1 glycoprotein [Hainan black-spectacled toad rhabdovirus]